MKQWMSILVAGFVGGLISFGLIKHQLKTNFVITESVPQVVRTSNPSNTAVPFDFVSASAKATPAVVHIKAGQSQKQFSEQRNRRRNNPNNFFEEFFGGSGNHFYRQEGAGSGVIIQEDGLIVTNNHVVGFADNIEVTLNDGRKYRAIKLGTDPSTDLAVIKIEATDLPFVSFSDSDQVEVGEWVIAVGNPFDYLRSTVTAGIVSAKGRDIDIIQGENGKSIEEFIQTDAVVNRGNSGGALIDADGNLIGINTAIATPTGVYAGYSFAIPSNLVNRIIDEILDSGGDIERARLGIYIDDLGNIREEGINTEASYGSFITEVVENSSADFAGLLYGDIIVNVNGTEVYDSEELVESLKFAKVGDTIRVKVIRNGERKTINVKMRKGT